MPRFSEQDSIGMSLQLGPGESAQSDRTDFDVHYFHLKRNSISMIWDYESTARSDVSLQSIDMRNANLTKERARDLLSFVELSKLSTDAKYVLSDPSADATTASIPASANNPIAELGNILGDFNTEKSSNIDTFVWNHVDFINLMNNYYMMNSSLTGSTYPGYGMVATPKMPHVKSIISPLCPKGIMYGVDSQGAFLGEGPIVSETERDASKLSDVGYLHDFVQPFIPNPKRFGFKVNIGGYTAAQRGTEITTIAQAQKLISPKVQLARKA